MKPLGHFAVGVVAILVGFAMVGESRAIIVSTYDHSGSGFASGNGADTYINENSRRSSSARSTTTATDWPAAAEPTPGSWSPARRPITARVST